MLEPKGELDAHDGERNRGRGSWSGTPLTGWLHEDNVRRLRRRIFKAAKDGGPGQGQVLVQDHACGPWSRTRWSACRRSRSATPAAGRRGSTGCSLRLPRPGWPLAVRVHCSASVSWQIAAVPAGVRTEGSTPAKLLLLGIPVIMLTAVTRHGRGTRLAAVEGLVRTQIARVPAGAAAARTRSRPIYDTLQGPRGHAGSGR